MPPLIDPRTLRGFRDYPPALMMPRERVLAAARGVYRQFGFAPIDTPALEYAEILLGKGGEESDRQVYRFRDQGDRDVALRFDLTVPFARFAAQYVPSAGVPFKRYAMGPVWRGENPTPGRFREFWQSDFDTIGTTSVSADAEVILVLAALMDALSISNYSLRVNNRQVLTGVLETVQLTDKTVPVLRALDKLPKIGRTAVLAEMSQAGITPDQAERVLVLAELEGANADLLGQVEREFPAAAEGVARLREVLELVSAAGVADAKVRVDLSIARGLDYYTGLIYETFLTDLPAIGSIASGGRYDNLAGLYTAQKLPGVGASLGVDRLLAALELLRHPWVTAGRSTPADVLVLQFDAARLADYHRVAQQLRQVGIATEVYPDARKPKAQFEYADKRGHRVAVLAGGREFDEGVWKVKDLAKRTETPVPPPELVAHVQNLLVGGAT